jgi:hypothetical protein
MVDALHPWFRRRRRHFGTLQYDSPDLRHFDQILLSSSHHHLKRRRQWRWLFGAEIRPVWRDRMDWLHDLRCKSFCLM